MSSTPFFKRGWWWAGVVITVLKLWLITGQTVYAVGPAFHDDKLFVGLAAHILNGDWLGPYNQFTLAKGPMYPLFLAGVFWVGLPLLFTQQLIYAGTSALLVRSLAPWLRASGQFLLYAVLLWNPMSYDAGNLSRVLRQNLYTPLALLVFAGLIFWYSRRREAAPRQAMPALLAGFSLGCFWLTREESVWLLPAVGLLVFGIAASLGRELFTRWRPLAIGLCVFAITALIPVLLVCTLNQRYYGWFGTVEFRASEFNGAYGALTRIKVGPDLPQVPITRQMQEAAYEVSPTFAKLRPQFEGSVGDHWIERTAFPASERQIRGGWFMWALRDAMVEAGLASSPKEVMRNYQQIADEVNAACDSGRLLARPPRSGFVPPLGRDIVQPLSAGVTEYIPYFVFFKGFIAYSPDSVGDYADLKPFRDLVGNRLSHAPRSLDPFPNNQGLLEREKVDLLQQIGLGTGVLFGWIGPFLLLIAVVRVIECLLARRFTFLLWLALSLLASCLAYLAINILIHVTSFFNMSPAAMATAYPLYLIALFAVGVDALVAWSRPTATVTAEARVVKPSPWLRLLPTGAALAVFAARLREIHTFASDIPYNDQWIIEAQQIIAPWLNGTLRPWTFFLPHFEHVPVWTRLLSWIQVAITGRWDPLLQMTVNASLHAVFIWLAARWVWQVLAPRAACFVTVVLILGSALPHAWENIAWGFQSQFPLALICLFVHVKGSLTHPVATRPWWVAQLAGIAGLFTLASMWTAPLVLILTHAWFGSRDRRALVSPAIITAVGMIILGAIQIFSPPGHSFAQAGSSPLEIIHSLLHQLGWPSGLPGAIAIVQLPWIIHALRLRRHSDATIVDRIIFALGLWSVVQAAGLALARTGDTGDFVSRYGDLFFIGVFSGALALTRLVPTTARARAIYVIIALLWGAVVSMGLLTRATEGHARYFHQTAAQSNDLRRNAIRAYIETGDRSLLERHDTRWVLTQSTGVVTGLLDQQAFRALLAPSINPANTEYAIGAFNRRLQSGWPYLLFVGLALFAMGLIVIRRTGSPAKILPSIAIRQDPWPARLAATAAVLAVSGIFLWSNPLVFDRGFRWYQILGGDQALKGLTFRFATETSFGPERLQGAAPLGPVELRNQFFGTAPEGPALTCTVYSSAFVIEKTWLIVPYAGYPVGHGNGLRIQILDEQGTNMVTEISCHGPNLEGISFWPADVSEYQGRKARLVLYDGRTETEAWVAASPPIPSDSAELATTLGQRLQSEKHSGLHLSLVVIAAFAIACTVTLSIRHKPQNRDENPTASGIA